MNIAIIDDNCKDSEQNQLLLEKYFLTNNITQQLSIHTYENEDDFFTNFEEDMFDFIFIDYYLNNSTGIDIAKSIRLLDDNVILIFITTSRDFAIDSYKVKASGYLVKPLVYDELVEIMSLIDYKKINYNKYIEIISNCNTVKILLHDIIYCDVLGHYVCIHTHNSGIYKTRMTFSDFIKNFSDSPDFLLCYKGCIINMNYIDNLDDYTFIMLNKERIPFRKKEKANFSKIYYDFVFQRTRG